MKRARTQPRTEQHQVQALQAEVASLKSQLEWFKQQVFGRKSEKRDIDVPEQPLLNGFEVAPAEKPPGESETITYTRRKRRGDDCVTDSGLRFDDSVEVKTIHCRAPELSGEDADAYEVVSEKVTYRLAQRRSHYLVLKYIHPVVKHRDSTRLTTTPAPPTLWTGSIADVSLVAGLLVEKFVYHLPLYRQHQRLARDGITVSRESLTNWTSLGIRLLEPIYDAQLRNILRSKHLAIDETPVKAGRAKKGKMHIGWYWPIYGEDDEVAFTYSASRGHQHLVATLGDYRGTLLTDGYAAYSKFARRCTDLEHAQCWSHSRREFIKADKAEPDAVAVALEHIGKLYQVETAIRNESLTGDDKRAYRQAHARPHVDAFFAWCDDECQRLDLVPSNKLAKALKYVRQREAALRLYLDDPEIEIDTNHLERTLRAIPMGKKAWLFCWTEVGARLVGIVQSLLTTCRLHRLDPYSYLVDVLQRVGQHPDADVDQLTPRLWKTHFAANPLTADA
jgi:transposase